MKDRVLARPNLKLFVFGAILLLAVQDVVTRGHSQSSMVHARQRERQPVSDATLQKWIEQACAATSSDLFVRISDEYYRRGEIKRAMFFLRQAEELADIE